MILVIIRDCHLYIFLYILFFGTYSNIGWHLAPEYLRTPEPTLLIIKVKSDCIVVHKTENIASHSIHALYFLKQSLIGQVLDTLSHL